MAGHSEHNGPRPEGNADGPPRRIHAIQLLRALAASIVAITHQAFAYADHLGAGLGIARPSEQASQSAVALFFIVSGYIMVVSSRGLFGDRAGRRIFWLRRCIRILPPYWLATFGLVALYLFFQIPFAGMDLLRSVALVPYWSADNPGWAVPLLWVGWTLFYEMVFYTLFGLGIVQGRAVCLAMTAAGLVALVAAGAVFAPQGAVLFMLTRPIVLIFVGGMALAALREGGWALPVWARGMAFAGAGLAFALVPAPAQIGTLDFAYLAWAGLPAFLLALALLGGPLRLPFFAAIDRLGDISYALYLLHMPVAVFWMWAYQKAFHPEGPWGLLITMVVATYAASFIAYKGIEAPLTKWLNARLIGPRQGDRLLQQSGV